MVSRRLILAVDRSERAARAAAVAADLASDSHSEVIVFHAREFECEAVRGGPYSLESHRDAVHFVQDIVNGFRLQGIKAWGEVSSVPAGQAARAILASAKARQADFIIIGSRGMSRLGALLVGSVGSAVISRAECPVVIAHHPDEPRAGGGSRRRSRAFIARTLRPSRLRELVHVDSAGSPWLLAAPKTAGALPQAVPGVIAAFPAIA